MKAFNGLHQPCINYPTTYGGLLIVLVTVGIGITYWRWPEDDERGRTILMAFMAAAGIVVLVQLLIIPAMFTNRVYKDPPGLPVTINKLPLLTTFFFAAYISFGGWLADTHEEDGAYLGPLLSTGVVSLGVLYFFVWKAWRLYRISIPGPPRNIALMAAMQRQGLWRAGWGEPSSSLSGGGGARAPRYDGAPLLNPREGAGGSLPNTSKLPLRDSPLEVTIRHGI